MYPPPVDLGPYFPYFPAGSMSKEELSYHLFKLDEQTTKIKRAFSVLVLDLQKSIEETSKLEHVMTLLKFYDKNFEEVSHDCRSIADVFHKISKYASFFDFDLIKHLTQKLGSVAMKKKMFKYKKKFQEFSKCRVCECPSDTFGEVDKSEKVYVLKIDKSLSTLTVEELEKLKYNMNSILGCNVLLRLLDIKDGCIELTFRTLKSDDLKIPVKAQQALRKLGVLSLSFSDKSLDISDIQDEISFGESFVCT